MLGIAISSLIYKTIGSKNLPIPFATRPLREYDLAKLLKRENKKFALSTQCIGLGMGIATIIESL